MMTSERWTERYIDVLAEAIVRARAEATLALCSEPLAESTRDLALGKRAETALSMWDALVHGVAQRSPEDTGLPGDLTRAMFTPEAMRLLLREVSRRAGDGNGPVSLSTTQTPAPSSVTSVSVPTTTPPPQSLGPASGGRAPSAAELLRVGELLLGVMESLDGACVEVAAAALPDIAHDAIRRGIYQYVERAYAGHEERLADIVMGFDPETARPILRTFAGSKREEAAAALARVTRARNPALRCEAVALAAKSADELKDELMKLAEADDPDLRFAALRTLGVYKVRAAGPLLVKRASDPTFQAVPVAEQKEIFEAIHTLHPPRMEALAIELVQKHGIMPDEPLDVTRAICAEMLGREARSDEALAAVNEAAKRRWWNGAALRDAATRAATAIAARLGKRIPPAGEVA